MPLTVLASAIEELREHGVPICTFALYHDHESGAISVCADTEANSRAAVTASNVFRRRVFEAAVSRGDLDQARHFFAAVDRNLSLGDFRFVNIARTDLSDPEVDEAFYLAMIRALWEAEEQVIPMASERMTLLFLCSGPNSEVEYGWSVRNSEASDIEPDGTSRDAH